MRVAAIQPPEAGGEQVRCLKPSEMVKDKGKTATSGSASK